jgi:succinate dehydrogenase hydrophobic anchor subunit
LIFFSIGGAVREVEGDGVKSRVSIVRVSHPTLFADLTLRTSEDTDLAHLSQRDTELLKESLLVACIVFHQFNGARVIEERLVRSEETQVVLQVDEVLVVEFERRHWVVEELRVVVVVGQMEAPVVRAVVHQLLAVILGVLRIHMWIDSIDDAVAVTLSDCVCTCMKHSSTAIQKMYVGP